MREDLRLTVVGAVGITGLIPHLRHAEQLARLRDVVGAPAIGEETVVADAMEAAGQHVGEEAADELVDGESHHLDAVASLKAAGLIDSIDSPHCEEGRITSGTGSPLFAAGHPDVNQVPLQHRVVLGRQRDDHGRYSEPWLLWIVVALGEHQLIELAKAVSNFATIEVDAEFAFLQIDANTTLLIVVLVVGLVFEAYCWPV
jgi:hypothetical protein